MQIAKAGLEAIYLSGWQVADAEAVFGGALNVFEIMKAFIEAGAAGVHFEDQLAFEKKCGHLGGKVLIPTQQHIKNLSAARLTADIAGTHTLIISRTDAESAKLITADVDDRDKPFIANERTAEGFYRLKEGTGVEHCIKRVISCAPYVDLIWMETSTPCLKTAKRFADAVRAEYPDQMFACNCSASFNWEANLRKDEIATFQQELGAMGFKFQFIILAGFHNLNYGMFTLAKGYKEDHMTAYSLLQQAEFDSEKGGYTATRHQREVGTGYFDYVAQVLSGVMSSTTALEYHRGRMLERGYEVETGVVEHIFYYVDSATGKTEELFNGESLFAITFNKKTKYKF